MAYPGGKAAAGVYQTLINQIPPHDVYVEPFLGDGAVMRRKRPAARSIGIELDPEPLKRWAEPGIPGLELYCCDGIEWLRHQFEFYRLPASPGTASPDPQAGPIGLATQNGDGGRPLKSAAGAQAAANSGLGPSGLAGKWFVYLDPPYLLSTRRSGRRYRCELTEADHIRILDTILVLPSSVAISGYDSGLYRDALSGWRSISYVVQTRGGAPATEWLWMNYPEPSELHDYSYLGRNKRQRERNRRRVRNMMGKISRLKPIERLAMLAALPLLEPPRLRATSDRASRPRDAAVARVPATG